jgi:hypothetical protein
MTNYRYKLLVVLLAFVIVVLLIRNHDYDIKLQAERKQRGDFQDCVELIETLRVNALQVEPKEAVGDLDAIVLLPPNQNTNFYGMVIKRARTNAVRDIIDYLRKRTGDDLGDDPQKWIKKYED